MVGFRHRYLSSFASFGEHANAICLSWQIFGRLEDGAHARLRGFGVRTIDDSLAAKTLLEDEEGDYVCECKLGDKIYAKKRFVKADFMCIGNYTTCNDGTTKR